MYFCTQAGKKIVCLHGCIGCNNYVWQESDGGVVCPECGADRFVNGKPKEKLLWFPLKERFQSLLRTEQFVESVKWEGECVKSNGDYVTGLLYII